MHQLPVEETNLGLGGMHIHVVIFQGHGKKQKHHRKTIGLKQPVIGLFERVGDESILDKPTIEKAILNNAIDNSDDQDIKDLRENLAKAKDLIANKEIATDLNFEFHSLLAKASRNSVFIIVEGAINAIHRNLRSRSAPDFKTSETAVREHEKILDALIKEKRENAINLLKKHILRMGSTYK